MTTMKTKGSSHVIKVTGVSDELLSLLDARIQHQHATGRSEFIRELIRREVLTSTPSAQPNISSAAETAVPANNLAEYLGDYIGAIAGNGEAHSEGSGQQFANYLNEKHQAAHL